MKPNYRNMADEALEKARDELEAPEGGNLQVAALQLRMSMEALTYERAIICAEELGPEAMKTWQPRILMKRILEIDPYADKSVTVNYGIESSFGEKPESMKTLGTEHTLSMDSLKKYYDALGSFLHVPTIDQIEQGKSHDLNKLRARCCEVAKEIEAVLSSPIRRVSFALMCKSVCLKCGKPLHRRFIGENRRVECWHCNATYTMKDAGNRKVEFDPTYVIVICPKEDCEQELTFWERDIKQGTTLNCEACGSKLIIELAVSIMNPNSLPPNG